MPRRSPHSLVQVGARFGSWTVITESERGSTRHWLVRCDCGFERVYSSSSILQGAVCRECRRPTIPPREPASPEPLAEPEAAEEWVDADDEDPERETPYATLTPCYYCGMPATDVDHVIPQVLLKRLATLDDDAVTRELVAPGRRLTVMSCGECNAVLNAAYFDTLTERKAYIKRRLRSRLRRDLEMPNWTASELATLAPRMQGYVRNCIERRRVARRRLAW